MGRKEVANIVCETVKLCCFLAGTFNELWTNFSWSPLVNQMGQVDFLLGIADSRDASLILLIEKTVSKAEETLLAFHCRRI